MPTPSAGGLASRRAAAASEQGRRGTRGAAAAAGRAWVGRPAGAARASGRRVHLGGMIGWPAMMRGDCASLLLLWAKHVTAARRARAGAALLVLLRAWATLLLMPSGRAVHVAAMLPSLDLLLLLRPWPRCWVPRCRSAMLQAARQGLIVGHPDCMR